MEKESNIDAKVSWRHKSVVSRALYGFGAVTGLTERYRYAIR